MKIILNGKAYVQMNDIMYLFHNANEIPASLVEVMCKGGKPFICTDNNRYDFVELKDKAAIDFFKNCEYSVDYLELKDKSEKEIIEMGVEAVAKRNELANKFNSMTKEEQEKDSDILTTCELLLFQILSLRDILSIKQGKLKIKMPNIEEIKEEKKPFSKIKKFFKKI